MNEKANLVSKVLVLDEDQYSRERIREFCQQTNLVCVKSQTANVMSVLKSNVDLGGIFLAQALDGDQDQGLALGRQIHRIRPELPIFLRCANTSMQQALAESDRKIFTASYTLETIDELRACIDENIFSLVYPNALVRGITEITKAAFESQFLNLSVEVETPYIVRDRLIFGEIFTLIPIEGSWCRGYMMLQAEENALMQLVRSEKTHVSPDSAEDFRNLNGLLGEITNLIWGSFKNRYIATAQSSAYVAQVPIVINHLHRYISFGSENPQLCFKYSLGDRLSPAHAPLSIQQRFVFNLNWSPEDFSENQVSVDDLVDSGELELF